LLEIFLSPQAIPLINKYDNIPAITPYEMLYVRGMMIRVRKAGTESPM